MSMGDDLAQPVHGCGGQVGDDRVGRVADPRVGPAGLEPRGAQLLQGPVRGGGKGVDPAAQTRDVPVVGQALEVQWGHTEGAGPGGGHQAVVLRAELGEGGQGIAGARGRLPAG
ncbi:hypothetical protein BJF82_04775 [Kytococcus sp. CUA-901]|nr:hypothetical protein BJF82_04775 [Kytococcus sp. CUA-901]